MGLLRVSRYDVVADPPPGGLPVSDDAALSPGKARASGDAATEDRAIEEAATETTLTEMLEALPKVLDRRRQADGSTTDAVTAGVAALDAADEGLSPEALARGFGGDRGRLRRFVRTLRTSLPPGTTIALRGSTIAGQSYKTGEPFDAAGPGTSDLDVVVLGEAVMDLWVTDAQLLGGINTLPLSDDADWVAPELDRARRRAQDIAGRPVSIQAMAGWFLDIRTLVQGQPYVVLDGDT